MQTRNAHTKGLKLAAASLAALTAFCGVSAAQSLKEIRARESEEARLAREARYTQSVCDHSFSARIDWSSAADWPQGSSLAASCDGALGAVEAFCRTEAGKRRIKRVTSFICAGDGAGPRLQSGALRYGAAPGDNGFAETQALLESAL
ncbi:MAG: hypothetical protein ACX939_10295 [Hyphococcus sp.]